MDYWQFKFKDDFWENFQKLEIGDIFSTSITKNEKNKLNNRVGDIVFWYRIGKKKAIVNGIYFITEIISNVREDEEYINNYSIEMRIVESYKENPFILENNGFDNILKETKKGNFFQYIRYLIDNEEGESLYVKLHKNQRKMKNLETLNSKDYAVIEKIKMNNINEGNLFNPFLDMNLIKQEIKHLSFIANLLNPRGTHFQGNIFFKNFIISLMEYESQKENIYLKQLLESNNSKITVETEKSISRNSIEAKGRIDIYIESETYIIAIEGKIEAKDQKNQLKKYDKFLQKQDKPYLLIYLTKEGEDPTQESPDKLHLMSFTEGILDFINYSLEEELPTKIATTLREYSKSLNTYLHNLEPEWKYTLDILDEITQSQNNFIKYQKIKDIYFRNPKEYSLSAIEDVALNFEKSKAYIELMFMEKLYMKIIEKLDTDDIEYELVEAYDNEKIIDMSDRNDITKMINLNHIYKERKNRLNPIKKTKDKELLDLGLVGFKINFQNDDYNGDICIMNTTIGLLITDDDSFYTSSGVPFGIIEVTKNEKYLDSDIFNSINIVSLLDEKILNQRIDVVMKVLSFI